MLTFYFGNSKIKASKNEEKTADFSACDEDEEMETTFTAGFIGLGLIGGSIARALKKYYPDVQILAHTRNRHTTEYALEHGIIDEICDTVDERYRKVRLHFFMCTCGMQCFLSGTAEAVSEKGCILTDVGSTKTNIHKR